jgi:hypothetical protein
MPSTDAGWDALTKLLPLNKMTWDNLYGEGTNEVIDLVKAFYSPYATYKQKRELRILHPELDAWGVKNKGCIPIIEQI